MSNEDTATSTCKICSEDLFVEQNPVHFACMSSREKALVDMVLHLNCEINDMKESLKVVDGIMKTLRVSLNIENKVCDCESIPESTIAPDRVSTQQRNVLQESEATIAASRMLRESTQEKSKDVRKAVANRNLAKKTIAATASKLNSRHPAPISPLATNNGTSGPQNMSGNKNKSTFTSSSSISLNVSSPPSSSASASTASSPSLHPTTITTPLTPFNVSPASTVTPLAVECGITVVPPPKSIFLSRLGVDVSTDQVKMFITTKIPSAQNISIRKMLFRGPRNYSSFVVDVGNDLNLFNDVVQQSFWPELTVVREFQHFLKPPRTANLPK